MFSSLFLEMFRHRRLPHKQPLPAVELDAAAGLTVLVDHLGPGPAAAVDEAGGGDGADQGTRGSRRGGRRERGLRWWVVCSWLWRWACGQSSKNREGEGGVA